MGVVILSDFGVEEIKATTITTSDLNWSESNWASWAYVAQRYLLMLPEHENKRKGASQRARLNLFICALCVGARTRNKSGSVAARGDPIALCSWLPALIECG
jgi:hypothetical protein